jgi:hypothetical protein
MNRELKRCSILAAGLVFIIFGVAAYPRLVVSAPQDAVVCTGWHALCSSSLDCKMSGDQVDCDCLKVNESHIVVTSEIQDPVIKVSTLSKCTDQNPCDVDEAPVCQAIQAGQYQVDQVKYKWVSTYSYRGWCEILAQGPIACDRNVPGYNGDRYWAICDAAPCVEKQNPSDPNKPLSCRCRVDDEPFATFGSCTGVNGGIMSSMPLWAWDFQNNTYTFPMPGYEFVKSACESFKSDSIKMEKK